MCGTVIEEYLYAELIRMSKLDSAFLKKIRP
jgi:hypothetical protein